MAGKAVVYIGEFEEKVDQAVKQVPEVEDAGHG